MVRKGALQILERVRGHPKIKDTLMLGLSVTSGLDVNNGASRFFSSESRGSVELDRMDVEAHRVQ